MFRRKAYDGPRRLGVTNEPVPIVAGKARVLAESRETAHPNGRISESISEFRLLYLSFESYV